MRTQIPIPSIRATKRETRLVLAVARYGDVEIRKGVRELAHRLAHRFGYLLETYWGRAQVDVDEEVPATRRACHRDPGYSLPPLAQPLDGAMVPIEVMRLRLLPSVEPAWAVALAEHVEQVR